MYVEVGHRHRWDKVVVCKVGSSAGVHHHVALISCKGWAAVDVKV